jgi:hypothetical protein
MATRIISEGPGWAVERTGPEEFTDFPGSFAEWVASTLEQPQDETSSDA